MALTYAAAGIAAGLSGTMLSAVLQTPWVLVTFAAIFVLLACSMFGLFELQLPTFLQSKLAAEANRLHGGHFAGVFGMGALSALIVGPCVAPPLAGALLYISQTREAMQGGAALFSMGLGMGVPLLLIGATGGAVLPRSGPWMESVKQVFGVVMLAVAIWLVTPLLPDVVVMLSWAALLHLLGDFPARDRPAAARRLRLSQALEGRRRHRPAAGRVDAHRRAVREPRSAAAALRVARDRRVSATTTLDFQRVRNLGELEARLAQARGKPVMLDFYADWCVACKEMDRFTFTDDPCPCGAGQLRSPASRRDREHRGRSRTHAALQPLRPPRLHLLLAGRQRDLRAAGHRLQARGYLPRRPAAGCRLMTKTRATVLLAAIALLAAVAGITVRRLTADDPKPVARTGFQDTLAKARFADLSGQTQPLEQWRGKVLVVNFWATWCPPCLKEIPEFIRMQARYGDRGLQFVGVAVEPKEKVAAVRDQDGLQLSGAHRRRWMPSSCYGHWAITHGGLPFTVVFDRSGTLAGSELGGLNEAKLSRVIEPLL